MITEAQFNNAVKENEETYKWRDLKKAIYEIIDYSAFDGKYGRSMILTLKNANEEILKVWGPKRLCLALEGQEYTHIRHNGLKMSKAGNEYWSFDLVNIPKEKIASDSEEDSLSESDSEE
jgi:hypothetical protein